MSPLLSSLARLLLLSGMLVPTLQAQQSDPVLKLRETTKAPRGAVLLDVVTPSSTMTLTMQSFALFDDGRQVPAGSVRMVDGDESAGRTRQILFVIDAVNSTLPDVTRSVAAIEGLLHSATGDLPQPLSIVVVADTEPKTAAPSDPTRNNVALHHHELFLHRIPASRDRSVLLEALHAYQPGLQRILESQAGAAQGDRVRLSLEALSFVANAEIPVPGAKLVVWISPGWPYLQSSSAQSSEQLFDSIVYFSNLLRSARILLDAVDPEGMTAAQFATGSFAGPRNRSNAADMSAPRVQEQVGDTFYRGFLAGVRSARESNPNDLALQVLASQSGGLVLQHSNDLQGLLTRCAAEASHLDTISYTPAAGDGIERYHELSLKPAGALPPPLRTRTGAYLR